MNISGSFRVLAIAVVCVLQLTWTNGTIFANSGVESSGIAAMTEDIKAGIENVVHIVSPRFDDNVASYLRSYIEKNRERTELMIGRSSLYFPMFETEMLAEGLPADLKYLAVVESALTPQAISRVGATGLWQFMRPTARMFGLQITKYVDERCDPVKSTRAAIAYLSSLYAQFNSWELAMAAYNAGPGRVRYAIRKSGSKDFWKLKNYLPRETRNYVPGFIAASYILNYYQDHGLEPEFPTNDLMYPETMTVYKDLTFTQIQQVTGVPYDVICSLNPKYIRKFIPLSESGMTLVLPASSVTAMNAYLSSTDAGTYDQVTGFDGIETGVDLEYVDMLVDHTYFVRPGDNLYNLARTNNCSVSDLQKWNKLSGSMLHVGQQLRIKKMEKVLVKTDIAQASEVQTIRHPVIITWLSSPEIGTSTPPTELFRNFEHLSPPSPVVTEHPAFTDSPNVLRRRMSLKSSRTEGPGSSERLTPGAVLK